MCRLLGVSTSGYYAWVDRGPSTRDEANARLLETINGIHQQSRRTYGAPRITAELREEGHLVGKNRVARLMKVAGIEGVSRRRKTRTTLRGQDSRPAPDLVERNFQVSRPNRLWVADITYVPSWAGFVYLAVVVDAFSRRVVGASEGASHGSETRLSSAREPASDPPWARSVTVMTTRCVRAFLPLWSVNLSTGTASAASCRPGLLSSTTSRAFTTLTGGTRHWTICRRSTMNRGTQMWLDSKAVKCPQKWGNFRESLVEDSEIKCDVCRVSTRAQ